MKQELRRKTIGLFLLCFLPVILSPAIRLIERALNQNRVERMKWQDVNQTYAIDEPSGDCLPQLIYWIKAHPHANRIDVTGWFSAGSSYFETEWVYNRREFTMKFVSLNRWENGGGKIEKIYRGVNDNLLHEFTKQTKTNYYASDFDNFCQANECIVEEK